MMKYQGQNMIQKTEAQAKLLNFSNSQILNLMSQIFPDDESINTLNSKQRKVFNVTYPSIM